MERAAGEVAAERPARGYHTPLGRTMHIVPPSPHTPMSRQFYVGHPAPSRCARRVRAWPVLCARQAMDERESVFSFSLLSFPLCCASATRRHPGDSNATDEMGSSVVVALPWCAPAPAWPLSLPPSSPGIPQKMAHALYARQHAARHLHLAPSPPLTLSLSHSHTLLGIPIPQSTPTPPLSLPPPPRHPAQAIGPLLSIRRCPPHLLLSLSPLDLHTKLLSVLSPLSARHCCLQASVTTPVSRQSLSRCSRVNQPARLLACLLACLPAAPPPLSPLTWRRFGRQVCLPDAEGWFSAHLTHIQLYINWSQHHFIPFFFLSLPLVPPLSGRRKRTATTIHSSSHILTPTPHAHIHHLLNFSRATL